MFSSINISLQIVGAFWYLLAVERNDSCWQNACKDVCQKDFLYCGNEHLPGISAWQNKRDGILKGNCSTEDSSPFDYGIFKQALSSSILSSKKFVSKYCYCLWWGLQNLRWVILFPLQILKKFYMVLLWKCEYFCWQKYCVYYWHFSFSYEAWIC